MFWISGSSSACSARAVPARRSSGLYWATVAALLSVCAAASLRAPWKRSYSEKDTLSYRHAAERGGRWYGNSVELISNQGGLRVEVRSNVWDGVYPGPEFEHYKRRWEWNREGSLVRLSPWAPRWRAFGFAYYYHASNNRGGGTDGWPYWAYTGT